MNKAVKKILLVQLFSNGDCLYATTVARQIKNDYPNCELTWAIAGFCKDIISLNPYVDHIRVVNDVPKNDNKSFRKFKKKVFSEKAEGIWDEVFVTSNMDNNQALYDGTIRGMVLRAYPHKITVPLQSVLVLSEKEINNVAAFSQKNNLSNFKNVILWEYAPQSGQSQLSFDLVMRLSKQLILIPSTCVILSSANAFQSTDQIIDASVLSVRENAALSHYCSLLIGCSSGITWLCASSAGKMLPMIQLLNPYTAFINAPSVDFTRYDINTKHLIEMTSIDEEKIYECVKIVIEKSFSTAREKYNQPLPLQFNTTRKVVYNMLCYLQFGAILKHAKIMLSIYGFNLEFLKQLFLAIITAPFKLISNLYTKKAIKL